MLRQMAVDTSESELQTMFNELFFVDRTGTIKYEMIKYLMDVLDRRFGCTTFGNQDLIILDTIFFYTGKLPLTNSSLYFSENRCFITHKTRDKNSAGDHFIPVRNIAALTGINGTNNKWNKLPVHTTVNKNYTKFTVKKKIHGAGLEYYIFDLEVSTFVSVRTVDGKDYLMEEYMNNIYNKIKKNTPRKRNKLQKKFAKCIKNIDSVKCVSKFGSNRDTYIVKFDGRVANRASNPPLLANRVELWSSYWNSMDMEEDVAFSPGDSVVVTHNDGKISFGHIVHKKSADLYVVESTDAFIEVSGIYICGIREKQELLYPLGTPLEVRYCTDATGLHLPPYDDDGGEWYSGFVEGYEDSNIVVYFPVTNNKGLISLQRAMYGDVVHILSDEMEDSDSEDVSAVASAARVEEESDIEIDEQENTFSDLDRQLLECSVRTVYTKLKETRVRMINMLRFIDIEIENSMQIRRMVIDHISLEVFGEGFKSNVQTEYSETPVKDIINWYDKQQRVMDRLLIETPRGQDNSKLSAMWTARYRTCLKWQEMKDYLIYPLSTQIKDQLKGAMFSIHNIETRHQRHYYWNNAVRTYKKRNWARSPLEICCMCYMWERYVGERNGKMYRKLPREEVLQWENMADISRHQLLNAMQSSNYLRNIIRIESNN